MNIFTYGSLMFPQVINALTGKNFEFQEYVLIGYDRKLLKDKTYPGLFENKESEVEGQLYFGIDEISLKVLDTFEDSLYERRIIENIQSIRGIVSALVYIVPNDNLKSLSSEPWSMDTFEQKFLNSYLDMCRGFREKVMTSAENLG